MSDSTPPPAPSHGAPSDDDLARATEELAQLTLPLMWRLRNDTLRIVEPEDLRPAHSLVLELIDSGMQHPKQLAEVLDASPPAVSSLLGDLEGKGLVSRDVDPDDRRRVLLSLTDGGRAVRGSLRERWLAMMQSRLARVDVDDLRAVIRVYRTLIHASPDGAGAAANADAAGPDGGDDGRARSPDAEAS